MKPMRNKSEVSSKIPMCIHQIWIQGQASLPGVYYQASRTWRTQNPTWRYRLWDDDQLRYLMGKDAPQWLRLYEAQSEVTAKADVGRYALLCLEGGLYADIDTECVRPISRMLGKHKASLFLQYYDRPWSFCGVKPVSYHRVANSIIASIPSHAIWSQVQAKIERNPSSMFIPSRTGPTMLWPLVQEYAEANPHDVFLWDHRQILTAFYLPRHVMRFYSALRSSLCVLDFNDSGREVLLRILHLQRQKPLSRATSRSRL